MLNWLRSFLQNVISNQQEKLNVKSPEIMEGILYFLASELSLPEAINAANLKISTFQQLPLNQKRLKFSAYYLELEQLVTEIDKHNYFSKASLRAHIQAHFPDIHEIEGGDVIFAPIYIHEVLLAKKVLEEVLNRGTETFRHGTDNFLVEVRDWLVTVPESTDKTIPFIEDANQPQSAGEWLILLRAISHELYRYLVNTCGKRHAGKAYEHAYKQISNRYINLEAFSSIIKLIPREIMDEDKINTLSKQQVNTLLVHQLDELRELNEELSTKNEELEGVHELLVASQRKTENTLKRFENIMLSIEEGIITVNVEGEILMANEKICEIWDTEQEEIIGKNIEILFPNKYTNHGNKSWRKYLGQYKESLLKRNIRLEGQDKNGRLFPLELSINEVPSDREVYFTIVLRDVTEELKREERLKQLNLKLLAQNLDLMTQEQELGTMNAELLDKNTQLEETFLALSERNFELDQFVYRVSHDMRSPLSSLMGLINLIRIEKTPTQDSEYINMLEDQVYKLDTFLTSMLNFSKASRGQAKQDFISFAQMLDDCLAEFEGHQHYYQLMVNVNIEGEDLMFNNDLTRMKIIVRNILSNAFEYLNPSAEIPFLHIYVKVDESHCRILFDDNGIGIGQDCLEKVFDMFYRATELSKGSGLGLYIVKQAIEKLEGTIQIESNEKKGTKIEITLPNLAKQYITTNKIEEMDVNILDATDQRHIA